jgi:hypothetical protein
MKSAYLIALPALLHMSALLPATLAQEENFLENARVSGWVSMGPVAKNQYIDLRFFLKLTHTQELKDIVNKVSDPKSPEYGHYLTKDQIDLLTKPTAEHISAVKKALEGHDVEIGGQGATITATVNISFAEKLFQGRFITFCHQGTSDNSARSGRDICVVRNPTATVPEAIRDACDIISPIDDGFPPVNPLPGPIISRRPQKHSGNWPIAFAKVQQLSSSTKGCCFSYGFGAMMKPCCLKVQPVDDVSSCTSQQRLGGASSYVNGECPKSAEEAAAMQKMAQTSTQETSLGASVAPEIQDSDSKSLSKSDVNKQPSEAFSLIHNPQSMVLGLAIFGGILVGIFFAARQRRDLRSTPFLHNDVAE